MNCTNVISEELKGKLIELDRITEEMWDLPDDDPRYIKLHESGKKVQEELMDHYGLSAAMINSLTYGEGGVIYG